MHLLLRNIMLYLDELSHDREAHKVTCVIWEICVLSGKTILVFQHVFAHIFFLGLWHAIYINLHIPSKTNMGPEHSSSKPLCLGSMLVFVVVHATRTCLNAFSVRVFGIFFQLQHITSWEFVPAPNQLGVSLKQFNHPTIQIEGVPSKPDASDDWHPSPAGFG